MDIQEKFDQAGHRLECDPRIWRVGDLEDFQLYKHRNEIVPAVNGFVCDIGLSDELKAAAMNYMVDGEHTENNFDANYIFRNGHPQTPGEDREEQVLQAIYERDAIGKPLQDVMWDLVWAFQVARYREERLSLRLQREIYYPQESHGHTMGLTFSIFGGGTIISETDASDDFSITYQQKPGEVILLGDWLPHRATKEPDKNPLCVGPTLPRLNIVVV